MMKNPFYKVGLMLLMVGVFVTTGLGHAESLTDVKVIESFTDYPVGRFPKRMRTFPFQRGKAKEVYIVAEEGGNKFLKADDQKELSIRVMRQFIWNIEKYPWISWKWRAKTFPPGGDERDIKNKNDSACGIYIVFGKYSGKALKYVWSTTMPTGTVVRKDPNKFHIIAKKTGPASSPNAWHRVSINVPKEFQENFGEKLKKNPTGFGILTDGNAVHARAACDYDDFAIAAHNPLP